MFLVNGPLINEFVLPPVGDTALIAVFVMTSLSVEEVLIIPSVRYRFPLTSTTPPGLTESSEPLFISIL